MNTVTKEFTFDAAHLLVDHEGQCANLHGHTYKVQVTLTGEVGDEGMLVDFGTLKKIVNEAFLEEVDHSFVCNIVGDGFETILRGMLLERGMKVYGIPGPATAEIMAEHFYDTLQHVIEQECDEEGLKVLCVRVWETPTSYAEYFGLTGEECDA